MWIPIFTTTLFIKEKTWKQPKYLPTDEWIKKMLCEYIHIYIYINTIEYYLAIKKNEIMPLIATWMDLEIIILSEINQKRKTNIIRHFFYVDSKEKRYKWTYLQNKNRSIDLENKLMITKGEKGGGIN